MNYSWYDTKEMVITMLSKYLQPLKGRRIQFGTIHLARHADHDIEFCVDAKLSARNMKDILRICII